MAKYGCSIGDAIAPAWRVIWDRERYEADVKKIGMIDWEWLMNFGREYVDAVHAYRGNPDFRGLYFGDYIDRNKQDALIASERERIRYDALWTVCAALHIPVDAIIRAVRIENHYYERGNTKLLDAERLVRSQI